MKKLILMIPIIIIMGCNKGDKTANEKKQEVKTETGKTESGQTKTDVNDENKNVYGFYTGDFEPTKYKPTAEYYANRITVSVDSIRGNNFYGHSVVAGNNRPFAGSYTTMKGMYHVEAAEPGDDKYDGKFSFVIYTDSNMIDGTWKANNSDLDVSERKYVLRKKDFKYNANLELPQEVGWAQLYEQNPKFVDKGEFLTKDVLKVNASTNLLTAADVQNMHKGDLEIIRNSIFARHGYSFKTRKMRFIFDSYVDWYMPVSTDVRTELTEIENKNVELIKRYEEHAGKYYDSFGR